VNFEEYLKSKKIDSDAFRLAEKNTWESWKKEFEQLNPVSFTAQKLYLINPTRRKFLLKTQEKISEPKIKGSPLSEEEITEITLEQGEQKGLASKNPEPSGQPPRPAVPKPVFRPKPKMN
jgi:hypothetical protein